MRELEYPINAQDLFRHKRKYKNRLLAQASTFVDVRIAVLGGSTTHDIVEIMELFLLNQGIKPVFYESEYAKYWEDAMFGNKALDAFAPDIIYIHTTNRNIQQFPHVSQSEEEVSDLLQTELLRYQKMWDSLREKYHCTIIQNNFEPLFYRLLGNRDSYDYRGRNHFIEELNHGFYSYANTHDSFYIQDIHYLAASYGLERWADLNDWYRYKYAMSVQAIPELTFNLASIIKSLYGKNKKFLALDLDNTLWGGVVGDDGVSGIEIGSETPEGQAYLEFQQYLRELQGIGVLLSVNSKNDEKNAREGLSHPSCVLHPDDFLVIRANWENKNQNYVEIAHALNLGTDAGVLIDDNPVERQIVCETVPGSAAPDIGEVSDYIKRIDRNAYFEAVKITADDLKRVEMYRQNAERKEAETTFSDYTSFLRSLEMNAEIAAYQPLYMPRIVQLTNKSNQFNLTTRRFTLAELEQYMAAPNSLCLYGKLTDRFGDNGIVSLSMGQMEDETMHIDLWLMSCRVLKRNMEHAMMDVFVQKSAAMGAKKLRGYYFPTPKNGMVAEFYQQFGFTLAEQTERGTVWELFLDNYTPHNHVIQITSEETNGTNI